MKTSLFAWIAFLALGGAAFAQAGATTPGAAASTQNAATSAATSRTQEPDRLPDGFTMINGALYEIRGGQFLPVAGEVTLRISPNGLVTGFDGRTYTLPAGVILSIEAHVQPFSGRIPLNLGAASNPPPLEPEPAPIERTTIYTGPEVISLGTSPFIPSTVVVPATAVVAPVIVAPGVRPLPAGRVPAAPATPPSRRPVTNNPFTGVAPAAHGVNTTATGNQQNTLGTQQIRPGMGNAVGTGGGPPRR